MKKPFFLIILFIFFNILLKAQNKDTIIISLSAQIGQTIDLNEKIQYHLFPYFSVKTFKQAQVFQNADSSFFIKATMNNGDIENKAMSIEELRTLIIRVAETSFIQIEEENLTTSIKVNEFSPKYKWYIIGGMGLSSNLISDKSYFRSSKYTNGYIGLGSGYNFSLGIGIKSSNFVSIELNTAYFFGDEISVNNGTMQASVFKINPAIKIGFKNNNVKPYLKLGPILSFFPDINLRFYDPQYYGRGLKDQFIETKGLGVGWYSGIGFAYRIAQYCDFFAEFNSTFLYHRTAFRSATSFDNTNSPSNTEITLKDNPDNKDNTVDFKNDFNLTSLGFNFGLNIYFK